MASDRQFGAIPERKVTGTPAFLSPEQADGRIRLDARSDLYSVGAMAFFLLAGQPPFVRDTVLEVLAAHRNELARFPDALAVPLPTELQSVVLRCLEKDPADRFADAATLEQALSASACAAAWTRGHATQWWLEHAGENGESPNQALQATEPA